MKLFAAVLIVQMGLVFASSAADPNIRLAIGTFGLTPEKRDGDLADVIAVRLSTAPGFELVERRELDAVLKEAGLSLSGAVRAKDVVRFGAMLRADQFLLGSSAAINGTNRLFVRLVDARTGVIRAINVFRDTGGSPEALASEIVDFVRAESRRPLQGHRDFLAIGVIQNLGVNNRFADFPAQMRGSIAARLSGDVTVLERDVMSFLANEVQLDTAGLTEGSGGQGTPMQFGFWIVDGFYQSYEVAEPEVQLNLRIERVQGRQKRFLLQGKPDEQFLAKICETVEQELKQPDTFAGATSPTRQGEIAALEARGQQLVDYRRGVPLTFWVSAPVYESIEIRSARTPEKVMSALDEATRVFESILLLDPENNAAKMRLAGCLLFEAERWGGIKRDHLEKRAARAKEYYREVIATEDPEYADDARINLALSCGGAEGVEMLRRFAAEATNPKEKARFESYRGDLLYCLECQLPVEETMPDLRAQLFDNLKELEQSTNEPFIVSFENVLFAYRFYPEKREKIINTLLPELLEKFPDLKPYILLAAAGEQTEPDSPIIAQFLASLKQCEEHPETVLHPSSYFTHLSTTVEDERAARSGWIYAGVYERAFSLHQYSTVVAMALARQRAAEKGLAPPLTNGGKRLLAESYAALNQWQKTLDIYNTLPDASAQEKNECSRHLGLGLESETIPDSAWKDQHDADKVRMAYDCIGRQQWLTAAAILDSIGHRTVRMFYAGAWGYAFAPVLPAVVADECRANAGKPALKDPMRFELGDTPYVHFMRDGPRYFSFETEGDDVWIGIYSQIKRFHGPGPFAASEPVELHEFQRSTKSPATSICLSPNFIWVGTFDDGLFELDRNTGDVHHITMNDGLLLNGISGLYLQGQTLWIAYQNRDNGAVGTLDLQTHKFSALTPNLRPEAGANSQPYYDQNQLDRGDQPPQLPISCMTEAAPGEMWFSVVEKGLQSYRNSDGRWRTIMDTFANSTYLSGVAADQAHGQVLVAAREKIVLDAEKSRTGGLVIYDYRQHRHACLQIYQGLPSNDLTAVATDGRVAWIGGRGFVAVVDVQEQKVLRIAYISANCIKKIQLGKTYAWIQVISGGGDTYPEYSGDAWTGVYRVERAAVEPIGYRK
jgi:hypothetical protein